MTRGHLNCTVDWCRVKVKDKTEKGGQKHGCQDLICTAEGCHVKIKDKRGLKRKEKYWCQDLNCTTDG